MWFNKCYLVFIKVEKIPLWYDLVFDSCKCCTVCTFDQQEKVMHTSSFWELQISCKKIKGYCVDNGTEVQLIIDLTRMILMVWFSRRIEWFELFYILNNYLYSDIKPGWNCNQKYKIRRSVLTGTLFIHGLINWLLHKSLLL